MADQCLGFNVRKTARLLAKAFDEAFAPCGLKSTQVPILVTLHTSGQIQVRLLAEKLDLDRTTLPRNLAPLERRGLVHIEEGADRRTRMIQLTDDGRALLREALPLWHGLQDRLVAAFGQRRAEHLLVELKDLNRCL
jgi:DNA-binding MarR family transcriptional regulator